VTHPKPAKRKLAPAQSLSYLDKLWSKVVRVRWHDMCAMSNPSCAGSLEAHHYIPRARMLLRHDPENGVLLCQFHHATAKYKSVQDEIEERMGVSVDYLKAQERVLFQDWLREHGLSRTDYRRLMTGKLKMKLEGK
jgi:hypothetical protein